MKKAFPHPFKTTLQHLHNGYKQRLSWCYKQINKTNYLSLVHSLVFHHSTPIWTPPSDPPFRNYWERKRKDRQREMKWRSTLEVRWAPGQSSSVIGHNLPHFDRTLLPLSLPNGFWTISWWRTPAVVCNGVTAESAVFNLAFTFVSVT